MHRHELVGRKGVVRIQHLVSKIAHEGFSCKVKVTEHFVRPPAAKESDDVSVHFGYEERHGTTSAEGAGRDLLGGEAQAKAEEAHCATQKGGDVGWFDAGGSAGCKEDPSQGSVGRGII